MTEPYPARGPQRHHASRESPASPLGEAKVSRDLLGLAPAPDNSKKREARVTDAGRTAFGNRRQPLTDAGR